MAADPCRTIKKRVEVFDSRISISGREYNLDHYDRIVVVGAGKAAAPMARALEEVLGDRIYEGVIIVKYGHKQPLTRIRQIEGAHPLPDLNGVTGTREIMDILKKSGENTLIFCLLSGGASSLLISPHEGLTLEDKQGVTKLLLNAGAAIEELNAVRKHLSQVKGGRLAEMACPATLITLLLSDVIGDRLDVIASGPTVPDSTTFTYAIEVIKKYRLEGKIPVNVARVLEDGFKGHIRETPKGGEEFFKKTWTVITGSIRNALIAARDTAESLGFNTVILTTELHGEAREAARCLADRATGTLSSMGKGDGPRCLLSGGETTVTVKGKGLGGRSQELALAFAAEIEGKTGITMLSAGTDGTDGPTDAAGAIVDGNISLLARRYGIDSQLYLEDNDSYHFFERLDSLSGEKNHLMTGPTGTNVMDMQIIIVDR